VDNRRLEGLRKLVRREDAGCLPNVVILIGPSEQKIWQKFCEALMLPRALHEISSVRPMNFSNADYLAGVLGC
jgi:hypothetical protein